MPFNNSDNVKRRRQRNDTPNREYFDAIGIEEDESEDPDLLNTIINIFKSCGFSPNDVSEWLSDSSPRAVKPDTISKISMLKSILFNGFEKDIVSYNVEFNTRLSHAANITVIVKGLNLDKKKLSTVVACEKIADSINITPTNTREIMICVWVSDSTILL